VYYAERHPCWWNADDNVSRCLWAMRRRSSSVVKAVIAGDATAAPLHVIADVTD
jgi:hypothetical protein